eukprot:m.194066 g.194066  ORF g.194066 m.194066 type:complete len:538 (+) comp16993_c0_seq12:82-1695(+)
MLNYEKVWATMSQALATYGYNPSSCLYLAIGLHVAFVIAAIAFMAANKFEKTDTSPTNEQLVALATLIVDPKSSELDTVRMIEALPQPLLTQPIVYTPWANQTPTALHLATRKPAIFFAMLERCTELPTSSLVKLTSWRRQTLLHEAARWNSISVVDYLLDNGAEIHVHDQLRETPTMRALQGEHFTMARLLLEHPQFGRVWPHAQELMKTCELHPSRTQGQMLVGSYLTDAEFCQLDHALLIGADSAMTAYCLRRGMNPNYAATTESRPSYERSPLAHAVHSGDKAVFDLLVDAGALISDLELEQVYLQSCLFWTRGMNSERKELGQLQDQQEILQACVTNGASWSAYASLFVRTGEFQVTLPNYSCTAVYLALQAGIAGLSKFSERDHILRLNLERYISYALRQYYAGLKAVTPLQLEHVLRRTLASRRVVLPKQLLKTIYLATDCQSVIGSAEQTDDAFLKIAYEQWGRLWMLYQLFHGLTLQHQCVMTWRQELFQLLRQGSVTGNVQSCLQQQQDAERKVMTRLTWFDERSLD